MLIVIISSALTSVFPQANNKDAMRKDSLYIDSMIRKIPVVRDTNRVNFMNNLSNAILRTRYSQKYRTDWAAPYIEMAYEEATALDFTNGIVDALMNKTNLYTHLFIHNSRVKNDNSIVTKKYENAVKELLAIAEKINNPEILGMAYGAQAGFFLHTNQKNEELKAQINSVNWYKKAPLNESRECEDNLNISYTYLDLGEFEKAFEYSNRALTLAKKLVKTDKNDAIEIVLQLSYINMADLYKIAGDYEMALNFLNESREYHRTAKSNVTWGMEDQFADIYLLMNKPDSAYHFSKLNEQGSRVRIYNWPRIGRVFQAMLQFDSANYYYNKAIDTMERRGVAAALAGLRQCYFGKAGIFYQQKKYTDALKFARKSLIMEEQRSNKWERVNIYELMSMTFHKLGKNDSAYLYLVKHNELKNTLLTRQFLWRLNNYKKEADELRKTSQINLLNKDNQLKEQKLKQQTTLRNSLIIGFMLLLLLGVFISRNLLLKRKNDKLQMQKDFELQKLESEKKQAELHQRAVELEMQALRAQMNPHFIFNCLSSINRFIFKNDNKAASDYLTRFSRLIRMVLMHSQKKLIPLEDELEMIRLYLDLERLRFKDAFDYSITTTNIVDAGIIFIPPLLLQPFCENAVWHGLMHKEGRGHLNIEISEVVSEGDKTLHCVIEDDGIGREKATELKSKSAENEKSMGLKITTERLALLNQENNFDTFYKIDDILNDENEIMGTKVQLKIKYKESVEELV